MSAAEQGRFCASCQKTVIDFTNMTDQQLAAFFKMPTGNVCGRFLPDQLERDITVPAKRIPWLRYFFQFTLPAFLLSLKVGAQKGSRIENVSVANSVIDTTSKEAPLTTPDVNAINGKVVNEKGNPIPYASVVIKGTKQATACDADGNFSLTYKHMLPITLQVRCVGFESREYLVNSESANELVLMTMQTLLMGEVVVVGLVRKSKKPVPLMSNTKRDTAFRQFSVYPNPARSNGTISMDCKKMPKGVYSLQVLSIDGRPVCTKQVELEQKGGLLRTDLPTLTAGHYMIRLLHENGKKTFTEKIQVL